ncbi:MAG: response regulator [Desulfobacteraceae bacterium]|nr:response regulator [Desulfobacteraceae bacterium]MBU4055081.1 CHASE domain-containing protein [Pseudomonadota bacterium]
MKAIHRSQKTPQRGLPALVVLASILAAGVFFIGWVAAHKDKVLRENYLFQTQLIGKAIDLDMIRTLSGSPTDLSSKQYLKLKDQLARAKTINGDCRFLYLMGKRENGEVFFFADSEPQGSEDESPAGQIYHEVSPQFSAVLNQKIALTEGPVTDHWGTWISALVPLLDPKTHDLVAVLGMDFSARDFRKTLFSAALPPFLATLFALVVLIFGSLLIHQFARHGRALAFYPGDSRLIFIIVVTGFFLSGSSAWIIHEKVARSRCNTFQKLAMERTEAIATALDTLLDLELEALARFYEASDSVSPEAFSSYTDFILKNPAIQALEWVEPVTDAQKANFQARQRAEGQAGFSLWERNGDGVSRPATGRNLYYPVVRISPRTGNEEILGFDQGSDFLRRKVLEESMETGLPECSEFIPLIQEETPTQALLVCRPVFSPESGSNLKGFAVGVLRIEYLLKIALQDDDMIFNLVPETRLAVLQDSQDSDLPSPSEFSILRPVFIFNKVFFLSATAGPGFKRLYPVRGPFPAAFGGIVFTLLTATMAGMILRKRGQLEEMVFESTEKLDEAENRIDLAIHGADLGIWDWDIETSELVFNELWAEKLGYNAQEIRQTLFDWEKSVPPEDLPLVIQAMTQYLEGNSEFFEMEHRLIPKSGSSVWVLVRGRTIKKNDQGKPLRICGTYLDITQRKQAEEDRESLQSQLIQAQKMEAVGRLAGGVAHDLNNMLSPIIGYGEMLVEDPVLGDDQKEFVKAILSAGFRARDMVRQLLAFGRKQTLEFKLINMNKTIEKFEKLLRRAIAENIDLQIVLSSVIQAVKADQGQIEQVIMNLVVNAAQAMPDGGVLTIKTGPLELDEAYADQHPDVKPGPHVVLAVSDTGCGMDEAVREKIFEPFFSTKGEMGTGLGLATVYGIIKQHGGDIGVYSEPDRGTTFKVYLPVSTEDHGIIPERHNKRLEKVFFGDETILLVEDNDSVRQMVLSILERQGYHVLLAENGSRALSVAANHHGPLHLLLTDVVMPGMNGRELFQETLKTRLDLRVLYMSGYAEDVIAHHGVLDEKMAFIQKPFTVQSLSAKVRERLDQDEGR